MRKLKSIAKFEKENKGSELTQNSQQLVKGGDHRLDLMTDNYDTIVSPATSQCEGGDCIDTRDGQFWNGWGCVN